MAELDAEPRDEGAGDFAAGKRAKKHRQAATLRGGAVRSKRIRLISS